MQELEPHNLIDTLLFTQVHVVSNLLEVAKYFVNTYVTVPGKRAHVAHIMIFLYRRL